MSLFFDIHTTLKGGKLTQTQYNRIEKLKYFERLSFHREGKVPYEIYPTERELMMNNPYIYIDRFVALIEKKYRKLMWGTKSLRIIAANYWVEGKENEKELNKMLL